MSYLSVTVFVDPAEVIEPDVDEILCVLRVGDLTIHFGTSNDVTQNIAAIDRFADALRQLRELAVARTEAPQS